MNIIELTSNQTNVSINGSVLLASNTTTSVVDSKANLKQPKAVPTKPKVKKSPMVQGADSDEKSEPITASEDVTTVAVDSTTADQSALPELSEKNEIAKPVQASDGTKVYDSAALSIPAVGMSGTTMVLAGLGVAAAAGGGGGGGGGGGAIKPSAPTTAPSSYVDNVGSIRSQTSAAVVSDDLTPGIIVGKGLINPSLYVDGIKVAADYDTNLGTLTPRTVLAEGVHKITYSVSDAAGNVSDQSPAFQLTIDATPPARPATAPSGYVDNVGNIQGNNSTAATTDDTAPEINIGVGLIDPKLYANGTMVKSSYDEKTGLVKLTDALTDGDYTFTYTVSDAAGNVSDPSPAFQLTIDTKAPARPATAPSGYVDKVGAINSTNSTAATTDDTAPEINIGVGLIDPKLYANGTMVKSSYDEKTGLVKLTDALTDGDYTFTYTVSDAAGNVSDQSPAFQLSIDTKAPARPATAPSGYVDKVGAINSTNSTAATTDDTAPEINIGVGLIDPKLYANGTMVKSSYDEKTGLVKLTDALTDGDYTFTYTVSDAAGNVSDQSPAFQLSIDTKAPNATRTSPEDSSESVAAGDIKLTFSEAVLGNGADNIRIYEVSSNNLVKTLNATDAVITGTGSSTLVSIAYSGLRAATEYYVIIDAGAFRDAAGNLYSGEQQTGASGWNFNTPAASITFDKVTQDNVVNDLENSQNIQISGVMAVADNLRSTYNASQISVVVTPAGGAGSAVNATNVTYDSTTGNWTAQLTAGKLQNGLTYTAVVTATGGAAGDLSTSQTFNVDTQAPVLPQGNSTLSISGDSGTVGDRITNVSKVKVTLDFGSAVTLADGEAIQVSADGGANWVNTIGSSKTWATADNAVSLSSGTGRSITVRMIDRAGNFNIVPIIGNNYTLDTLSPTETLVDNGGVVRNASSVKVKSTETGFAYLIRIELPTYSTNNDTWALDLRELKDDGWIPKYELSDANLLLEKDKTWKKVTIDLANQDTEFDLTGLYDGKYALLTADAAGNTSLQSSDTPQTITIDSKRPGIAQFAPTAFEKTTHYDAAGAGYYNSFFGDPNKRGDDSVYLNLKAKMAEDGDLYLITHDVDSKDLYFNGVLTAVQARPTTQWRKVSGLANETVNINLVGLAEGSYYLMSVDKAGNTSHDRDGDMPNVVIDNTRPTASTTSSTTDVYQTSEKKISVTSSEDGYGYMVRRADTAASGSGHTVDHQELYTEIFTSNDDDHLGATNMIPDNAINSMQLTANVAVNFDLAGLKGGKYSFVAVDRAGNTSHKADGDLDAFTFEIKEVAALLPAESVLIDLLQTNGTILNGNEQFFVTKNLISHNDLDVLLNGGVDTVAISGDSFSGLDRADTLVESSGKTWKLLDKAKLQTITDKALLGTTGGEFWTSDMATDAGPNNHIAVKLNAIDANSQMSWANSYAASDADLKYAVFQLA